MKTALLYGGNSLEHEISILSALQVVKHFKEDEVILVYVSKKNRYYIGKELYDYEFYSNPILHKCKEVVFIKKNHECFLKVCSSLFNKIKIDMVFPIMHGTSGEDGCIQGMLELMDIPYAQSKLSTCAIFMDKDLTRKMYQVFQIPHTKGMTLYRKEILVNLNQLNTILIPKPWILKPAKGGSSIGINCVYTEEEMNQKVCETMAFDSKMILEEKLENAREFNIAVIGNDSQQILSNIEEIYVHDDYYSYTDKYGGSIVKQKPATRMCPAILDEKIEEEIRELAKKAYIDFECSGVVRFDFLYRDHLMMNEVNIIPGSYSFYLFKEICTPKEIIEMIYNGAMEGYLKKKREVRQIDSFIFKKDWQMNNIKK